MCIQAGQIPIIDEIVEHKSDIWATHCWNAIKNLEK